MDADTTKAFAPFGFLTILDSAEHGLFGGYLVLSPQGRPLEFRCSTPIVASRAQEILYGPTLRPYLFADVIGQSLVAGAEVSVEVILTDQFDMLPLALHRPEEVLCVTPLTRDDSADVAAPLDVIWRGISFEFAGCRLTADGSTRQDATSLQGLLHPLAQNVCLLEPFERIRTALAEAQIASQEPGAYADDQAAA